MIVGQLIGTAIVVVVFVYLRKFIIGKGRRVFSKAPAAEWVLSGFLAILGAWIVLNIWGIFPLLTNTAVIGVWLFFALWFAKDFFIDDYLAGIKLLTFYKLTPGSKINVLGEDCVVEEIRPRETLLKTSKGHMVIPNVRLTQLAIIIAEKPEPTPSQESTKQTE